MRKNEWEPNVSLGVGINDLVAARPMTSAPLRMRKRDKSGKWVYRDPTPEEIEDYLASEAW